MRPLAIRKRPAWLDPVARLVAELGPYLTIALLLPGGSVIALLHWLHRRIHRSADHALAAPRGLRGNQMKRIKTAAGNGGGVFDRVQNTNDNDGRLPG